MDGKTIVRRRKGQEDTRLSTTDKKITLSVVNSALAQIGARPVAERARTVKPRPVFNVDKYNAPLTNRMVHSLDRYFQGQGYKVEYQKIEQVFCVHCGKRGTWKRYHFRGRFCQHCRKAGLTISTVQFVYWYKTLYTRYRLNCTTGLIVFQVETCTGKNSSGWTTKLQGYAARS